MTNRSTVWRQMVSKIVGYSVIIGLSILFTAVAIDRLLFFSAPWLPLDTARKLSANAKIRRVLKAPDSGVWVFDAGIRYGKAGASILGFPTDSLGYRNPPKYFERNGRMDVLLLGDSMVWGTEDRTIADYLRETLHPATVYGCGIPGISVPQWALHYRRFITLAESPPRVVVLNFYSNNDLKELNVWREIKRRFGTVHPAQYHAYRQGGKSFDLIKASWLERNLTLIELRSLWRHLKNRLFAGKDPEGSFAVLPDKYPTSRIIIRREPQPDLLADELAEQLGKLIADIRQTQPNTAIILSYISPSAVLYGKAITNCTDCEEDIEKQAQRSQQLQTLSRKLHIAYIDVTPDLQNAAEHEIIWDLTHFNARGYELYARYLGAKIKPLLQDKTLTN